MQTVSTNEGLAPEDRVCLTGLDQDQVQEWSLARIEEHKARIHALSSVHAAAAPINRLPPAVLTRIFGYLHPRSYRQLRYLRVCRLWRTTILRTPPFWADILSAVSLNMMDVKTWESRFKRFEFFLAHSSPRAFDLTLNGCPAPVLEALTPHAHRIRSITLEIEALEVERLDRLLSVGMPLLEHLSIVQLQRRERKEAECNELFATPIHLDPSKYPRLDTLHIARPLFTTANAVPSIRMLRLTQCICTDCLYTTTQTFTSLLDALEQCPALEELWIEDSLPPDHTKPAPASDRIVNLPALRALDIDDHFPRTSMLLSHIDFPANTPVTIAGVRFWRDVDNFKKALPPDLTRFHPIAQATEVSLEFGETTKLETYAGKTQLLTLTITEFEERNQYDGDKPMRYVSELADMFAPVSTITVLSISVKVFLRQDWVRLLGALPNLVSLDVEGCDGVPGVAPALTQGPTTGGCLCPALEELVFFWNYTENLRCSKTAKVEKIRTTVGRMRVPPKGGDDDDSGASYDSFGVPVYRPRRLSRQERAYWGYDYHADSDEEDPDAEAARMAGKWKPNRALWEAEDWHPSYPAVEFFGTLLAGMLKTRAEHGKALKVLFISVPQPRTWFSSHLKILWNPDELEKKLAKRLGKLVGKLVVTYHVS